MRPVIDWRSGSRENYKLFCKNNKELKNKVSFKDYLSIINTYNEILMTHILETGELIKLPYGLGTIVVNKYRPVKYKLDLEGKQKLNLKVDFKETKKQGKTIYHLNHHSEGYRFYWMWNYFNARFKMPYIWKFTAYRKFGRVLKQYICNKDKNYQEIYQHRPRVR